MYSKKINSKVNTMFDELEKKVSSIVRDSSTSHEAIDRVTAIVSSELTARSKSILSDMLFDLSDELMETEFFKDISRQNQFSAINLRQEILSKYQFTPSTTVDYRVASREIEALAVGGSVLVVGGIIEVGTVLIKGLSLSSLVPIPISVLLVASIGAALADYFAVSPNRSKKQMVSAIDAYLEQAKQQFLDWFDEVENYFNMRVEEIKKTM
jgi:hypothetical protein